MKFINVFFFVLGLFAVNTISAQNMSNGKKIYETRCLVCHQADGGGVPNMNAPLDGASNVGGSMTLVRLPEEDGLT